MSSFDIRDKISIRKITPDSVRLVSIYGHPGSGKHTILEAIRKYHDLFTNDCKVYVDENITYKDKDLNPVNISLVKKYLRQDDKLNLFSRANIQLSYLDTLSRYEDIEDLEKKSPSTYFYQPQGFLSLFLMDFIYHKVDEKILEFIDTHNLSKVLLEGWMPDVVHAISEKKNLIDELWKTISDGVEKVLGEGKNINRFYALNFMLEPTFISSIPLKFSVENQYNQGKFRKSIRPYDLEVPKGWSIDNLLVHRLISSLFISTYPEIIKPINFEIVEEGGEEKYFKSLVKDIIKMTDGIYKKIRTG